MNGIGLGALRRDALITRPSSLGTRRAFCPADARRARALGHKPDAEYQYSAQPLFLFEPHQPEMCNFKPQVILNIDEVWQTKRKSFEILAAQKHLWA